MTLGKVWCDEDDTDAKPGDFYVDCHGTWIVDPDGSRRGFYDLTPAERRLCSALIRIGHLEEAVKACFESPCEENIRLLQILVMFQ